MWIALVHVIAGGEVVCRFQAEVHSVLVACPAGGVRHGLVRLSWLGIVWQVRQGLVLSNCRGSVLESGIQ